jgi:hypothetical protein
MKVYIITALGLCCWYLGSVSCMEYLKQRPSMEKPDKLLVEFLVARWFHY